LADDEWCRAHGEGYDQLLERLAERTVAEWIEPCDLDVADVLDVALGFARTQPALVRLGVGAQRHSGAPIAYRTVACLPALVGAWRHTGGGCSYVPTATAAAASTAEKLGEELLDGPVRTINMSQLGQALTDPDVDPPVCALVVWNSNPAQIAPSQEQVLAGLRREDLFCVVLEQFMTDTAAHADVVLPATTQLEHSDAVFSWGHHYMTWNEAAVAPRGEAKPNSETFRLIAARMGIDHPLLRESDEEVLGAIFDAAPIDLAELRERGWVKIDLGQGDTPHADGGFVTASGKLEFSAAWLGDAGIDTLPFFDPPAEGSDPELARRFPLALVTPKTHLFLNSTFPNQERQHSAQPEPELVVHPDDATPRGIADGTLVRAFNDRGSFACRVRVSDDTRRGVVIAPMGWWKADWPDGRAAQATTSQRLTKLGNAPTFNDNRVELEPAEARSSS
jgi:anaerobic selenocysteine-containing dehydrogenase